MIAKRHKTPSQCRWNPPASLEMEDRKIKDKNAWDASNQVGQSRDMREGLGLVEEALAANGAAKAGNAVRAIDLAFEFIVVSEFLV